MPYSKLSDLLPIDPSVEDPNAYQVFGLRAGETDSAKVSQAIKQVIASLETVKAESDPEVWKHAAKLAGNARKLLRDPERRIALDESLKASGMSGSAEDPLAGLLPGASPASRPDTDENASPASAAAILGIPPGASATPLGTPPLNGPPSSDPGGGKTSSSSSIDWTPPKPKKKRRKKSNAGVYALGFFVLVMLAAIVGLLQFLQSGGKIEVGGSGDAPEVADGGVKVSEPVARPPTPQRPGDGVLGPVASSGAAANLNRRNENGGDAPAGSGLGSYVPIASDTSDGMTPSNAPGSPADRPGSDGMMNPAADSPEPNEMATDDSMGDDPPDQPLPPEVVQENQQKIDEVERLIAAADWRQMKPAADALLERKLSPEQFRRASTLYDIADLATYYRGAIERGLATLSTGNTFEVVDDFQVIVVEATDDSLSIRYNKKTQTYNLDELPPRLTEKLASFALEQDRPDSIAGLALYRLIQPNTNDEYRQDALKLLGSVDGQLDKVDTASLQKIAAELLAK